MTTLFPLAETSECIPLLAQLTPETQPRWGTMSAQRMIEHLESTVRFSFGDQPLAIVTPEDKLPLFLQWLRSDKPLSKGQQSPIPADTPLQYPNLQTAIDHLQSTLQAFFRHYAENPSHVAVHAYFGPIGFDDWQRFHQKHFRHHLTQFGLLED